MIITKLIGGLGNQMFQYAAGRALAYRLNTELKLDKIIFKTYKLHKYELYYFNIKALFASQKGINKFKKHSLVLFFTKRKFFKEKHFHFNPEFFKLKGNIYLKGYWPSEKYFKSIESVIRDDFSFKNEPDRKNKKVLEKISKVNSVSIHIRRGDYVLNKKTNAYHGLCPLKYYKKAIQIIKARTKTPTFFVFSDDIKWCKKNIKIDKNITFIDFNNRYKNYEDMRLMSNCKHNIIANSSFSWWGAWLNKNKNKIVIAPKKWFRDPSINTKDLISKLWLRV